MGEVQDNLFEPEFNRSIKVQGTDHRLTSNAGVVLLREADHRLGLLDSIAADIPDPDVPTEFATRSPNSSANVSTPWRLATRHKTISIDSPMIPPFAAVWDRSGHQVVHERLASQPTQSRLIHILTSNSANHEALRDGLAEASSDTSWHREDAACTQATIDIDSFPIEVTWQTTRSVQRLLQKDGLSSVGRIAVRRWRLRQHARRQATGQRLRSRDASARSSSHGQWHEAFRRQDRSESSHDRTTHRLSNRCRLHDRHRDGCFDANNRRFVGRLKTQREARRVGRRAH